MISLFSSSEHSISPWFGFGSGSHLHHLRSGPVICAGQSFHTVSMKRRTITPVRVQFSVMGLASGHGWQVQHCHCWPSDHHLRDRSRARIQVFQR